MKEMNVIGTMQLLAACQKSPRMRKLVVKSTSAVYGSSPRDPAVFTEDMGPKDLPSSGYAKDAVEVEGYVRGFARRRPDVDVTTLRFTNFIGPRIDTVLTRYFALPVVPTVLGYDARVQLLHSRGRARGAGARHDARPARRVQRRRRRGAAAVPGHPPGRPGPPAGAQHGRPDRWGASSAAPGSSTSRPTR